MSEIADLTAFRSRTEELQKNLVSSGWKPSIRNPNHTEFFIYLYDVLDTGYLYMMSGKMAAFDQAVRHKSSLDDVAGYLGTLMKENITEQSLVIGTGVTYFSKTRTYQLMKERITDSNTKKPIAIILRYGHPKFDKATLRPFALFHETGVLSPNQVLEQASVAITQDKAKHPEWFQMADVVPINPRPQNQ